MICRDFIIRVCCRKQCKMHHKILNCTNASCNGNKLCKFVHLTECEIREINENVRPFRLTIYNEMKRLAFLLRESFPVKLRTQTCTLYLLGECLWPCITCGTASSNTSTALACNKCYILLESQNIEALFCGHTYCKYCMNRLPFEIGGALPTYHCVQCNK
ncbi:hypothetical protein CAJAP_05182 [Camponotus japonicus]